MKYKDIRNTTHAGKSISCTTNSTHGHSTPSHALLMSSYTHNFLPILFFFLKWKISRATKILSNIIQLSTKADYLSLTRLCKIALGLLDKTFRYKFTSNLDTLMGCKSFLEYGFLILGIREIIIQFDLLASSLHLGYWAPPYFRQKVLKIYQALGVWAVPFGSRYCEIASPSSCKTLPCKLGKHWPWRKDCLMKKYPWSSPK